ncbi:YqhA family protein [Chryseolinea sp. T2]|uniref:YqhA family protein n=1 Tax=Chryseolinea sp. T2 TaxID=3129255 RepID=UPI003077B9EB
MERVFKIAIAIIGITMLVNFLFIVGFGVYKTFHGFDVLLRDGAPGKPGLEIVESLDLFLVALVFLILGAGFMKLFYPEMREFKSLKWPWLKIDNFNQLKELVWNAFLLTLLITFGTQVLRASGSFQWTFLIIPVSVLLFALSARVLRH